MVFFELNGSISAIVYAAQGFFTREVLALCVLLGIPFLAAMTTGALLFRGSSDTSYRKVAYALIASAAVLSLPLFDRFFR